MDRIVNDFFACQQELSRLQGFWVPIQIDFQGEARQFTVEESIRQNELSWVVIGERCYSVFPDGNHAYGVSLLRMNPLSYPKQLKLIQIIPSILTVSEGYYELDGDLWSIQIQEAIVNGSDEYPIEFYKGNFQARYQRIPSGPPEAVLRLIPQLDDPMV